MFKKILIANRGEIAVRVIRTCREMGIKTVAVFSEVDRTSPHVLKAHEAYCIGSPSSARSYMNMGKIINIVKKNNYSLTNQIFFIAISMLCLLIDNLLEAYTFENRAFILIIFLNLFIIHAFPPLFKLLKISNEI